MTLARRRQPLVWSFPSCTSVPASISTRMLHIILGKPSNVTAKLPLEMQLHHFRNVASSARHLSRTAPKLSSRGTVLRRAKFSQSNRFHPREARLARILHTDSLAARI